MIAAAPVSGGLDLLALALSASPPFLAAGWWLMRRTSRKRRQRETAGLA